MNIVTKKTTWIVSIKTKDDEFEYTVVAKNRRESIRIGTLVGETEKDFWRYDIVSSDSQERNDIWVME